MIDARDESILATHEGAASVKQLRDLFDMAESGTGPSADGDRLYALGQFTAAAIAYRTSLHSPLTKNRGSLAVKYMAALVKAKDRVECERGVLAMEYAAEDHTASAADFASLAQECASPEQLLALAAMVESVLADPAAALSIDDRTDAMRIQRELYLALGNKPKADALAAAQYAILRNAVATAPDAGIAMTYNWPLAEVGVYLGKGQEIIPILEKSVEKLPNEYDPPYRLAWVYEKLGQRDKAVPLADLALSRAYGARKKRIQDFRDALSK